MGKESTHRGEDGDAETCERKALLHGEEMASEEEDELLLEEDDEEVEDEGTAVAFSGSSTSGGGFVGEPAFSNQASLNLLY